MRSSIKTLRSALYSIVPIMATEMGLSELQAGTLLTGFFPGVRALRLLHDRFPCLLFKGILCIWCGYVLTPVLV